MIEILRQTEPIPSPHLNFFLGAFPNELNHATGLAIVVIDRIWHLTLLNGSGNAPQGLWKGLRALKILCEGVDEDA